jgi:hypothetical protein
MTATFGEALEAIASKFDEVPADKRGLKLDLYVSVVGEPMSYEDWQGYLTRENMRTPPTESYPFFTFMDNGPSADDALWDCFPDERTLAIFSGVRTGYRDFQEIATEAYHLLCETDPTLARKDTYHGWIRVLHDIARYCPTQDIGYEVGLWGHENPANQIALASMTDFGVPVCLSFTDCVFRMSRAALGMFLRPYATRFLWQETRDIRLRPWQLAAVFASPTVLDREPKEIVDSRIWEATQELLSRCGGDHTPRFIAGTDYSGTLTFLGRVIKELRAGSKNVFAVCMRFEQLGWPREINNPIQGRHPDGLAREVEHKLNAQVDDEVWIRFKATNSGRRIRWSVAKLPPPQG